MMTSDSVRRSAKLVIPNLKAPKIRKEMKEKETDINLFCCFFLYFKKEGKKRREVDKLDCISPPTD